MIEFTIMVRRPQETTRLIREATSAVIDKKKFWCCESVAWSIHDFLDKNCNIFVLKVKKLDEEVIDIGREFQMSERRQHFLLAVFLDPETYMYHGLVSSFHNYCLQHDYLK